MTKNHEMTPDRQPFPQEQVIGSGLKMHNSEKTDRPN